MKRINKFKNLSSQDQQIVLKTCAEHPYHVALRILAQPREQGGLNLHTSRTALSHFVVHHHPDQRSLELMGQYADAVRIKGQAHLGGALEATLTLVQARILEALKSGKPIADLDREFRSLERLQRCLVVEEKRRYELGNSLREDYHRHINEAATAPATDFIRNDLPDDPGAAGVTEKDFSTLSDREIHTIGARIDLKYPDQNERPRNPTLLALRVAENQSRVEAFGEDFGDPILNLVASKMPDFPHFPPNPASKTDESKTLVSQLSHGASTTTDERL